MVDKELSDFMPKANSDGELVVGELLSDISTPIEKKLIIAKKKKKLPKVIIPVHFAGLPCDMKKINDLSKKYGWFIKS